jgi:GGDEF domain-containing protein
VPQERRRLARLGGDEFAILLSGLQDDAQANAIGAPHPGHAESMPFAIAGRECLHVGDHCRLVRSCSLQ